MKVRITIDIFSGRSNPVLELDGPEAKDALRRLQPAGKPSRPLPVRSWWSCMGTPRSSSPIGKATGGAYLFSGRPEPTWPVPLDVVRRLLEVWESLEPSTAGLPPAPPLGYRGCFLKDALGRQWIAYGGVVRLQTADDSQLRRDEARTFEKILLSSAPAGVLPPSVLTSS